MSSVALILGLVLLGVGLWRLIRLRNTLRQVTQVVQQDAATAEVTHQQIEVLTAERNQATAVLESMAEGVIALDPQGRVVLINPSAGILLGLVPGTATGQSVFELVRQAEIQALVRDVLPQGARMTRDVTVFQPTERILRVHGVPCQPSGPSGPRAVFIIQDVTELHRYEQLRREFVANVSHELKSPLTSIQGLTEALLEGALDDAKSNRRFVQLIDEDAARLSGLIDDLLTLSQIESQAIPLQLASVNLPALVESITTSLQLQVVRRRLTVTTDLPPGLTVSADPDRLRQALFNLLDNAVKYNTEGGRITVAGGQEEGWVRLTISDTGIGIPTQDLPRIFERFYRVDKARSRELGGTGLGLSIVKHVVEAHNGTIAVESQLHQGSTFTLRLPA